MMKKNTTEIPNTQIPEEISEVEIKKGILKKLGPKKLSLIVLVIIAIIGLFGSYYFYKKYTTLKANPNIEVAKETERLILVLGKLIELPKEETPTIVTVSDKDKLKDQAFFTEAENGDILFVYTTAMKAILYRPSSNKIINLAPININQTEDITGGVKNSTSTPATSNP